MSSSSLKRVLFCTMILVLHCSANFNVLNFGAKGDGTTVDTSAIQAAINAAFAAKGGVVLLPQPHTFVSGSLFLKSNVVFSVEKGATLLGSPLFSDYPKKFRGAFGFGPSALLTSGNCLELASSLSEGEAGCLRWEKERNVTIEGGGTIDGNGHHWWFWYGPGGTAHTLLEPTWVDGLVIQEVTLRASPFWTVHPMMCTNVVIRGITLLSDIPGTDTDVEYNGHNVDGVDPDNCVNVTIADSVIRAGDDCVALYSVNPGVMTTRNVTVRNVTCYTPLSITHGLGTADVLFDNCTVRGDWGPQQPRLYRPAWWKTALRIKTSENSGSTGGFVRNVQYRDIAVVDVDLVADFQQYYPCQNSSGMANYHACQALEPLLPGHVPQWDNISFDGVHGSAWRAAWLNCNVSTPCNAVSFHGVQLTPVQGSTAVLPYLCANVRAGQGGLPSSDNSPPIGDCLAGGSYH